ncbi:MAG: cation:proton antiporter subunit C [Defluviitaleaceae bacterium]|nr:cation:proton antiporter subunit C [Defluviitaleaceae bacterium]MCL2215721.1 cation:proton antiporter subunit C [Defluviitaleaceae bacterium]
MTVGDIHVLEIFPILVFFISFFGLIISRNIVKAIVLIMLMQTSVILFWLGLGARLGNIPPIFQDATEVYDPNTIADPLPQALMLTAIIIGIAVTAINITLLNALFRKYQTVDWQPMQDLATVDERPES